MTDYTDIASVVVAGQNTSVQVSDADREIRDGSVGRPDLDADVAASVPTEAPTGAGQQAATSQTGELRFVRQGVIDARVRGAVGDSTTDNTAILAALWDEAKPLGAQVYLPEGKYLTEGIAIDYDGDTPNPGTYGFRGVPLAGNGTRGTILLHKPGSTTPLISIRGRAASSDTSHQGKVTGALIEGMELRGQGKTSGNLTPLVELSIYEFAALRDLFITEGGGPGVSLRRPVKSEVRDDHSHMLLLENIKVFRNGGPGIVTPDDHAVGPASLVNVESSYNGGLGFDVIAAGMVLTGCGSFGNEAGGLRSRTTQNGSSSVAQGLTLVASRFEGDAGIEVDIQGGDDAVLLNCTIYATHANGYHAVVMGDAGVTTRAPMILGGIIAGNGGATGTAGQRAVRIGTSTLAAFVLNPRIDQTRFADSYIQNDPYLVVADLGGDSTLHIGGRLRGQLRAAYTSSASNFLRSHLQSDTQDRLTVKANGDMAWGSGSAAGDVTWGRLAANVLGVAADDAIRTGRGATGSRPSASTAGSGAMWFDTTLNKPIWSDGTAWRDAAGTTV